MQLRVEARTFDRKTPDAYLKIRVVNVSQILVPNIP
jgi:hypothetical protein